MNERESAVVIRGDDIATYRLMVVRSALKLEARGMQHSGGAIRPKWASILGLKPRDKRELYIAKLTELIEAAKAAR